ncbi:hypothetical protein FQA39_LY13613 [Lamprigera yunnana]|nr:hypothetical protein FQA39_LY13613 [Lamprigera yunnana]
MIRFCAFLDAHGNANIERSFSHSSNILSEERANMSLNILNALINVQEVIRNIYYNKPELVMITKELLGMARTAYNAYSNYLEAERQKKVNDARKIEAKEEHNKRLEDTVKELEAKKKELEDAEKNLKSLQASQKEETEVVKTLLKDANKKLPTAIKSKETTLNGSVAKVLLETAIKPHEKKQESEKKIVELQRKILKRKKNTLDNFLIVANKRQATEASHSNSD